MERHKIRGVGALPAYHARRMDGPLESSGGWLEVCIFCSFGTYLHWNIRFICKK